MRLNLIANRLTLLHVMISEGFECVDHSKSIIELEGIYFKLDKMELGMFYGLGGSCDERWYDKNYHFPKLGHAVANRADYGWSWVVFDGVHPYDKQFSEKQHGRRN